MSAHPPPDRTARRSPLVVVMGVAGSGKSTVGPLVADALGVPFLDADDFHDRAGIERMRAGIPLDEAARAPWLHRLHAALESHRHDGAVLACSALTASSRARLGAGLEVCFVSLAVPPAELQHRLRRRRDHFAGPELLPSQLATLETGPGVDTVDGNRPPPVVAADVVAVVTARAG